MKINIFSPSFGLTPAIVQHVESRVSTALAANADHIEQVIVRLQDINGPRGGADKECRIVVWHQYLPAFAIEVNHQDLYTAISEAAGKAKEKLWRNSIRRRTLRRHHIKRSYQQMFA